MDLFKQLTNPNSANSIRKVPEERDDQFLGAII